MNQHFRVYFIERVTSGMTFDSGRTDIKKDGRDALTQVAKILATINDRRFEVAGHTDNGPRGEDCG